MADAIYRRGPWSIEVFPYHSDESVCEWIDNVEGPFFYFYDILPLKLGIKLPFTHFEWSALRALKKKASRSLVPIEVEAVDRNLATVSDHYKFRGHLRPFKGKLGIPWCCPVLEFGNLEAHNKLLADKNQKAHEAHAKLSAAYLEELERTHDYLNAQVHTLQQEKEGLEAAMLSFEEKLQCCILYMYNCDDPKLHVRGNRCSS
ncbi:hypothetical protein CR513_49568, partial [Mucuna pruriens]